MAIKTKEEKSGLPSKLKILLTKAFSLQALRDAYDDAYKGASGEIKEYFKSNSDGFDVSYGKGAGFSCDEGSVQISLGKSYETDVDQIIEMVNSNKITLTSLLGAVTFNQSKLQTVLGSQYESCVTVSEKPDVTITLKGNKDFKEQFSAQVGDLITGSKPEPKPEPKSEPKPDDSDSLAKAKAAAAAAKSAKSKYVKALIDPLKPVESDLDEILAR
jgi:hypothetical protein